MRPLTEDDTGDRKVGRIDRLCFDRSNKKNTHYYNEMDIMWNYDTDNSVLEESHKFSYSA